jgi:hypothetical protein
MNRIKSELLAKIIASLVESKLRVRVKLVGQDWVSEWSKWISTPSPSYFEIEGSAPERIEDIQWVEVESSGSRDVGRLVPAKRFDLTDALIDELSQKGLPVSRNNGLIRVEFS